MRYTNPSGQLVFQPPEARIARVAERHGLEDLTNEETDFVLDAYNIAYGAAVKRFDYDDEGLAFASLLHAEKLAGGDRRREETLAAEYVREQAQLHTVLKKVRMSRLPGRDPLTKAVRLLKYIKEIQKKDGRRNMESILLTALALIARFDSQVLALFAALGAGINAADDARHLAMEIAVYSNDMFTEMVRIASDFDNISESSQEIEVRHDPNGEDITIRTIREYGEITKAGQQVWGLPRRLQQYKAITGQLDVRQPITRASPKQAWYFLVDVSSSMSWDEARPIGRAVGVLLNRLRAVAEGDAEVFLRRFSHNVLADECHADSPESAEALMKKVSDVSFFTGGGTNFVQPIEVGTRRSRELVEEGTFRNTEIVLITDGQATLPELEDLDGITLHAVQVGDNEIRELSKLATDSGGTSMFVSQS